MGLVEAHEKCVLEDRHAEMDNTVERSCINCHSLIVQGCTVGKSMFTVRLLSHCHGLSGLQTLPLNFDNCSQRVCNTNYSRCQKMFAFHNHTMVLLCNSTTVVRS